MYATVTDIIIVVELFGKLETYDNSYLENIITYWKESEQRKKLENKFGLFQIQLWGLRGVTTLRKLCNFCPELSKETVFFFFIEHSEFYPCLFYKHIVPERLSSQSNKI